MNALESLLALSTGEKERLGVVYTPGEIARQPDCWRITQSLIESDGARIQGFLAPMASRLFKSLALGLRPDCPSKGGVINRVVKGVRLH